MDKINKEFSLTNELYHQYFDGVAKKIITPKTIIQFKIILPFEMPLRDNENIGIIKGLSKKREGYIRLL